MDQLPVIEALVPREISSGDFSTVLDLQNGKVVKVPHAENDLCRKGLEKEGQIADQLYHAGVIVPASYGVHDIRPMDIPGCGLTFPNFQGLVMDKIKGVRGDKVAQDLKERVKTLFSNEVRKARIAGFTPFDEALHNTIYDHSTDTLYLIDFDGWRVDEEKLFKYQNSLN